MNLSELLSKRRALVSKLNELESMRRPIQAQLEELEEDLFGRLGTLAAAIDGGGSLQRAAVPKTQLPFPRPVVGGVSWADRVLGIAHPTPGDPAQKSKLMSHIVDVLRRDGPLTRSEIYQRLVAMGVPVAGKDPKANVSAHLSYSDEVVRGEDGRWMLVQGDLVTSTDGKGERQTPA